MKRSGFLAFLVFLFIFCFELSLWAEMRWMTIGDDLFSDLRDFENIKPDEDFKFILDTKTNEMNVSDFIEIIGRAKNSKYNNFVLIDVKVKPRIFDDYIVHFCRRAADPLLCAQKAQRKIQQAITSLGHELSRSVRYPYNYHLMDTPEGRKALSEAREFLTSSCPDCGKIRLDQGSQDEFNKLFPLIKKQKYSCLKKLAGNMLKQLRSYGVPDFCEKNKARSICETTSKKNISLWKRFTDMGFCEKPSIHPVCESIFENNRFFRDRLLRLSELVYGKSARSQTEMMGLCLDCSRFPDRKQVSELDPKTLEDVWQQSRNCEELQPGEQKRVSSGTGKNKEYTVRREKDGVYSAVLNLQFVAADDYEGSVSRDQVPSYYRNRIQECLKEETNTKLLGPNGEKLQIVLEEKSSNPSSCPEPATVIKVGKPKVFSNESKYASDIVCPTITHEILHQLGLCDDYAIERRGYIIDSKTGKPIEVRDPATGKLTTEVESVHAIKLAPDQKKLLKYDCRVTRTNSIMAHHYQRWNNVFHRETKTKSLVTAQQFSAILYGDCKSRNKLFNECSRLARKNSFEDPTCLEKRRQCESQNALGGH